MPKLSFQDVLDRADDFRPKEVVRLQFDPLEAKRAANTGIKTLKKFENQLRKGFPGFEIDALVHLPAVCDELSKVRRVAQGGSSATGTLELVSRASRWRRTLLPFAQALASAGKIDGAEVSRIERGTGPSDTSQDVLELVELLTPVKKAVASALGPSALIEAKSAGEAAIAALGGVAPGSEDAAERRDRLATLVVRLHERLRAAVTAVTSYPQALVLVPPLASGGTRAKAEEAPSP